MSKKLIAKAILTVIGAFMLYAIYLAFQIMPVTLVLAPFGIIAIAFLIGWCLAQLFD